MWKIREDLDGTFDLTELLRKVFGVSASLVFCLQDFSSSGFMDLTFFQLRDCVAFFEAWEKKKDHQHLKGLQLFPAFAQDFLPLIIHLYNPKRRYLVKLHPPCSFFIGSNRGFLHYPGQPVYCRRCGAQGHMKADCAGQQCRFCGSSDHVATDCPEPQSCSLCGGKEHLFRSYPNRQKTYASLFKEGQDLQMDFEGLLATMPVERDSQQAGPSGVNPRVVSMEQAEEVRNGDGSEEIRERKCSRFQTQELATKHNWGGRRWR